MKNHYFLLFFGCYCQMLRNQRHHQNLDENLRCANLLQQIVALAVGTSGSRFGITTISNYKEAVVWDNICSRLRFKIKGRQ
jgi:hypothetical protein